MEEYANNSKKAKSEQSKSLEKVVSGDVKVKKKNEAKKIADEFIAEDIRNVKSYLLRDILIPSIKKTISDIICKGTNMVLNGEDGTKKSSTPIKASYRNYYEVNNQNTYHNVRKTSYSFDDIIIDSRADAEEVLDNMRNIIETYGVVSVADMYDLVGISGNYTDNKYGWTDLRSAKIERERDGGYIINLPRAIAL